MPFQLSPGIAIVEKDFSSIVPAVSSSAGAYCGPFAWGPIEDPVRVSSENDLVARFGDPKDGNYQSFFTAANFLSYANNILITRTDAIGLKNAVSIQSGGVSAVTLLTAGSGYTTTDVPTVTFSAPQIEGGTTATGTVTYTDAASIRTITGVTIVNAGTGYTTTPTATISVPASGTAATVRVTNLVTAGIKIKNASQYLSAYSNGLGSVGPFAAKFAGKRGNGIRIVMLDSGNWASASPTLKAQFDGAPGTSTFANTRGITNDEVHIAVFDTSIGTFNGVAGALLEKFSFVSKLSDAKRSDGSNNYYKTVLNSQSRYVWWMDHPIANTVSEPVSTAVVLNTGAAAVIAPQVGLTNPTITITGNTHFTNLAAYKAFFDAAPDKTSRQIQLAGSTNSNGIFNVDSITTVLTGGNITSYVITLASGSVVASESPTNLVITSITKPAWGQNADVVIAAAGASTVSVLNTVLDYTLAGGDDDFQSNDDNIQAAYLMLTNTDQYDISLLPLGNVSASTAKVIVESVAEARKDCVVFISPNTAGEPITSTGSTATDAIIAFRNASNIDSSYAVMDSGFKYQYDRYNDKYRFVPLSGDIAGLCARTDYAADPWFSPGGFNRGQIKNVVKLAFNPSQADRDALYSAGVNPVVSFPGQGVILYGDKTLLKKPSAFDRINVRRLFIVLEKSVATAAKYQMFEFNDSFTRAQFKNLVEPFLRDVQGRRGVTDFRVKCDESNNTGEVIDRNEFVADIFIKPNRSVNYITLTFVAARSSVSFEEIGA
jgi:phage tail sheath protein FI